MKTTANNSPRTTASNSPSTTALHTIVDGVHKTTVQECGLYCIVTDYENMGGRWVQLGPETRWDTDTAAEEYGFIPSNNSGGSPIYSNPWDLLQDWDPDAAGSVTTAQQEYLWSCCDWEPIAFTVENNSNSPTPNVVIWDSINGDTLDLMPLGSFVVNTLREARDAE